PSTAGVSPRANPQARANAARASIAINGSGPALITKRPRYGSQRLSGEMQRGVSQEELVSSSSECRATRELGLTIQNKPGADNPAGSALGPTEQKRFITAKR